MNTNTITHDVFNERLMAFLEGELDDTARAEVERHASHCAECGSLLADIRSIRSDAAKLPVLVPSHDLWAGIAQRIEAPVVPIGSTTPVTAFPAAKRRVWQRSWVRRAAWAASLVGAVGVGYFSAARTRTQVASIEPVVPADTAPALAVIPVDSTTPPAPGAVFAQQAVARLTADYDREITRLRVLVDERRNQMDAATVAIIEKNLKVIDAAITESKVAIARDPASRFLIESLNASLESKVQLLRIAAALPNRS